MNVTSPPLTRLLAACMFLTAIAVYLFTMPLTITLEDAGLFQLVCSEGGLAHPPGYPLFTMACRGLVVIPDISNGNMVSALFGALTIPVFFLLLHRLTGSRAASVAGALAYAFSACFWAQATIIEVYTLAALLFFLTWYFLDRFREYARSGDWYLACLLFSLSLSNHWPLALLSSPALFVAFLPVLGTTLKRLLFIRFAAATVAVFTLGLTPYLYLVTRPDDIFGVYGPIKTTGQFVDYILRATYDDDKVGATLADKLGFLAWLPLETIRQVGFPVSLLAIFGVYSSFRETSVCNALAIVLNYLGATFLLALLLGFEFDRNGQALFMPYPIIAYGSIAIWIGFAIATLSRLALPPRSVYLKYAVSLLVVGVVFANNFSTNNRSNDTWVEDYFRTVLEALPEQAVLFVDGDLLSFPIGYLHYVKGERPDLAVYNWNSLTFPNRLSSAYAPKADREAVLIRFVEESARPVFTIEPRIAPVTSYGLYNGYRHNDKPSAIILPEAETAIDTVLDLYERGAINRQQELELAEFIIAGFTKLYLRYQAEGSELSGAQATRFRRLLLTFSGKMMLIEQELLTTGRVPDKSLLVAVGQEAEAQLPTHLLKRQRARLYYYLAEIQMLSRSDFEKASTYLKQSIEQFPSPDNPAFCALEQLADSGSPDAKLSACRYTDASVKPDQTP